MSQSPPTRPLTWLEPGEPFPSVDTAWGPQDPAPGLLAAGGVLDVPTLVNAYSRGIFPWYSEGEPILWWSPDPRCVLRTAELKANRAEELSRNAERIATQGGLGRRVDVSV